MGSAAESGSSGSREGTAIVATAFGGPEVLAVVPVEHPTLKRARLVINNRLLSVVEVYRDRESGSGQIDLDLLVVTVQGLLELLHRLLG